MEEPHHKPVVDTDSSPEQADPPPRAATGRTGRRRTKLAVILAVVVIILGGVAFFTIRPWEPRFQGDLHTLLLPAPTDYPGVNDTTHADRRPWMQIRLTPENTGGLTDTERRDLGVVQDASTAWVAVRDGDRVGMVFINLIQFGSASKAAKWVAKSRAPMLPASSRGDLADIPGSRTFELEPGFNSSGLATVAYFSKHDIAAQVTYIWPEYDFYKLHDIMRQQYARLP